MQERCNNLREEMTKIGPEIFASSVNESKVYISVISKLQN